MYYLLENIDETFRKINQSSLTFLSPLTPEEMYMTIVEDAIKLFHAFDGRLLLKNDRRLETVYASGDTSTYPEIRKKGFTTHTLKEKKIKIVYANKTNNIHPILMQLGIETTIFIPLFYKKTSLGVLNLRLKRQIKTNKEIIQLLKLYGSLASMTIQKIDLYTEVKRALEVRDLFIALASHELRTPLTGVSVYAQLLEKRLGSTNTQEGKWVKSLLFETQRLTALIQELLQIDQIKTEKFSYHLETLDLTKIINQAITNIGFLYPGQKIEMKLTQNKPMYIMGDKNKLLQVFINILSNAAKFSLNNSPITIATTYSKNKFTVTIINIGKGIPKKDMKKVFERFYKASNNFTDGMGLGLFLTKKIVKAHKGSISIESKLNKATSVHITLPERSQ